MAAIVYFTKVNDAAYVPCFVSFPIGKKQRQNGASTVYFIWTMI